MGNTFCQQLENCTTLYGRVESNIGQALTSPGARDRQGDFIIVKNQTLTVDLVLFTSVSGPHATIRPGQNCKLGKRCLLSAPDKKCIIYEIHTRKVVRCFTLDDQPKVEWKITQHDVVLCKSLVLLQSRSRSPWWLQRREARKDSARQRATNTLLCFWRLVHDKRSQASTKIQTAVRRYMNYKFVTCHKCTQKFHHGWWRSRFGLNSCGHHMCRNCLQTDMMSCSPPARCRTCRKLYKLPSIFHTLGRLKYKEYLEANHDAFGRELLHIASHPLEHDRSFTRGKDFCDWSKAVPGFVVEVVQAEGVDENENENDCDVFNNFSGLSITIDGPGNSILVGKAPGSSSKVPRAARSRCTYVLSDHSGESVQILSIPASFAKGFRCVIRPFHETRLMICEYLHNKVAILIQSLVRRFLQGRTFRCGICLSNIPLCLKFSPTARCNRNLDSRHFYCRVCLAKYVEFNVDRYRIPCPSPECGEIIRVEEMAKYVPARIMKMHSMKAGSDAQRSYLCDLSQASTRADQLFLEWAQTEARVCPACRVLIYRYEGCNNMTCTCGRHFRWCDIECSIPYLLQHTIPQELTS
mmetsp:Transcript_8776/g.14218  ORF Transcript_8776/g.14218 Transcript_8776/m.14218 type:complete len:581 (-) Transcript_8776:36-1778(-)